MKALQYAVGLVLAVACLAMAGMTLATSRANQKRQQELALKAGTLQQAAVRLQQFAVALQNEQQTVVGTEKISRNVLMDLGNASVTNAQIRALLAKHGYTLTPVPPATNAPAAVPPAEQPAGKPAAPVEKQAAPVEKPAAVPAPAKEPVSVVTPPVSAPPEPAGAGQEKKP